MFELRDYQKDAFDGVIDAWQSYRNVMAVLPTGAGKCQAKDTPILMYDGTIKLAQDIVVGDVLMGPDSKPRNVLSIARGRETMYDVVPVKGETHTFNESHVLSLKQTGLKSKPNYPSQQGKGDITNITIKDYIGKSATFKHTHKIWRTAVEFYPKYTDKYLPPYLLGLWLGDGAARSTCITSADAEIASYIRDYVSKWNLRLRVEDMSNNAANNYHIVGNGGVNGFRRALRNNDLIENKHIPHRYLCNDRDSRLELLAGLLDSDGHLSNGYYDVVFKLKTLADGIAYLARSLGFAAYITKCKKTCTNTGATGDYYRVSISGDVSLIPTKLKRHQPEPRRQKKSVLVTGVKDVINKGEGDYYGFEIDGDHLYLLGDFTVTHNTVVLSNIVHHMDTPTCVIAHRQELVSQISLALARNGIAHRIVGSDSTVRMIVQLHMFELGKSWVNHQSKVGVAGVDTLIRRSDLKSWCNQVKLWVIDECHHLTSDNKWGKAVELFPNAYGLGVTATPMRADGKGLGRHHDGMIDHMIIGPNMRHLIDCGYLTDYRLIVPPATIDSSKIKISKSTGDYTDASVREAVGSSAIVGTKEVHGDIVTHYKKFANGKLGITFVPSIAIADEVKQQFIDEGIQAEVVTGSTPDLERAKILRRFKNRELLQLINVDLFGEGFDLPAIEVVTMARPTKSYGLYVQQFGRALRLMNGKDKAIIIDHVGNISEHGLPDMGRPWSLDRRDSKQSGPTDAIPLALCVNPECLAPYEKHLDACPFCGHVLPPKPPGERGGPEFVDGNLLELDDITLAEMRRAVEIADGPAPDIQQMTTDYHTRLSHTKFPQSKIIAQVNKKYEEFKTEIQEHEDRKAAQSVLRDQFAWWAGHRRAEGLSDSEIYKLFYFKYDLDWLTARTISSNAAYELTVKLLEDL